MPFWKSSIYISSGNNCIWLNFWQYNIINDAQTNLGFVFDPDIAEQGNTLDYSPESTA